MRKLTHREILGVIHAFAPEYRLDGLEPEGFAMRPALVRFPEVSGKWTFYEKFANQPVDPAAQILWLKPLRGVALRQMADFRIAYMNAFVKQTSDIQCSEARQFIEDLMRATTHTDFHLALVWALQAFDSSIDQGF